MGALREHQQAAHGRPARRRVAQRQVQMLAQALLTGPDQAL